MSAHPKRWRERSRAFLASVVPVARRRRALKREINLRAASATSSTARSNASALACEGSREAAHLAHELERGSADFLFGRGRLEVEERADVAAHGKPPSIHLGFSSNCAVTVTVSLSSSRLDRRRGRGSAPAYARENDRGRSLPAFLRKHHEPTDLGAACAWRRSRLSALRRPPRAAAPCRAARSDRYGQNRCRKSSWRRQSQPCRAAIRGAKYRERSRSLVAHAIAGNRRRAGGPGRIART